MKRLVSALLVVLLLALQPGTLARAADFRPFPLTGEEPIERFLGVKVLACAPNQSGTGYDLIVNGTRYFHFITQTRFVTIVWKDTEKNYLWWGKHVEGEKFYPEGGREFNPEVDASPCPLLFQVDV